MSGRQILTLDDLLTVDRTRKVEPVDVPEWAGRVYVRELNALEREVFDAGTFKDGDVADTTDYRLRLVALCLSDQEGRQILTNADAVAVLGKKSASSIRRVFDVAAKLNKVRKSDEDAEKKDSALVPSDSSSSVSPSPSVDPT